MWRVLKPERYNLPGKELRTNPDALLEQTEPACKHLFAGLEEYESLLPGIDNASEPGPDSDLLGTSSPLLRFMGTEISRATLAGSILQVAYSGIEAFSENTVRPASCDAIVDPKKSRGTEFCIGRLVPRPQIIEAYAFDARARQIPAGIVVYAARNQYCHWHEIASKADDGAASPCNPIVMNVFSNLTLAYYSHPFLDLAFNLGNPLIPPISAYHIVRSVLEWQTYEDFSRDMRAMLCKPNTENPTN